MRTTEQILLTENLRRLSAKIVKRELIEPVDARILTMAINELNHLRDEAQRQGNHERD